MASVQPKKNKWYFVVRDKKTKKYTWVASDVEVDRTNARAYERSKKRAERALAVWEKENEENGVNAAQKKILFGDFITQWLEHHDGDVNEKTIKSYKNSCNKHIIPYFNERKVYLQEVKPADLQGYFDTKKKILSITTLKKHKAYLAAALKYARLLELIKYNPLESVKLGKQKGSKFVADWYDDEETAEVINLAKKVDEPILSAIFLSSMLGLRREECCGLSWNNINWQRKTICINQTASRVDGKYKIVKIMKTDTSFRELPLPENVITFLKEQKKRQEENKKIYGNTYNRDFEGCICLWSDGRLITPDTISRRWKSFLELNNLKIIRFQDLRASFGTNMLRAGVSPERVAKLMGHSGPATLLKYYARYCDDDLVQAIERRSEKVAI